MMKTKKEACFPRETTRMGIEMRERMKRRDQKDAKSRLVLRSIELSSAVF